MTINNGEKLEWRGCYKGTFDLVSPESFAHPAKMAPALCYRILEHLEELGLLHQGDTILDPMGGTGLTAIVACSKGYQAITCELEEKFVGFQKNNKDYAARRLHKELDWTILQGDARNLSKMLGERGLVTVSSPPYFQAGSEPNDSTISIRGRGFAWQNLGDTPGQIGNLKDRPITITSPPYADINTDNRKTINDTCSRNNRLNSIGIEYGSSPGQIGSLPDKPITVTSPPYEDAINQERHGIDFTKRKPTSGNYSEHSQGGPDGKTIYGQADGQIGQEKGQSYLSAMSQVYAEIGKVSNVLCLVLKNPTRNGKLRRLDLDTIAILEATGWTIHCQHRALLFEEQEQGDLFNGSQKKVKGRMSFFKRLSYAKGQPVAQWEDIIICVRGCC